MARLNLADISRKFAFHHACIQDETKALRTLLQLTNDVSILPSKDHAENTMIMQSISRSHVDCAQIILQLEDVSDTISEDGWAPIHYTAKSGDPDLIQAVVEHPAFLIGMRTLGGKRPDVIAMEAGNWGGRVRDIIKEYDFLSWTS
ncbi:hypothetical protein HD806DRAFT_511812 [Xylariaceae sp. AK1471]|nr:hypothetical protein HD806DRAFT_511812 [Xylariaceae sp. AK1471]